MRSGNLQFGGVDQQIQSQAGFIAESLGKTPHQVHQIGALDLQRAHIGDHAAKLICLITHGLLQG